MSQIEINITVVIKGHTIVIFSQPDLELKSEAIHKKIGP